LFTPLLLWVSGHELRRNWRRFPEPYAELVVMREFMENGGAEEGVWASLRHRRQISASARRQRCRVKQRLRARSTQQLDSVIVERALSGIMQECEAPSGYVAFAAAAYAARHTQAETFAACVIIRRMCDRAIDEIEAALMEQRPFELA
jgi:hypothetical protein